MSRRRSWCVFVLGVCGCSLMKLDDFVRTCSSDEQCEPATRALGHDPASCRAYVCSSAGFCEPARDLPCDERDNDCDGFIDESDEGTPPVPERLESGAAAPMEGLLSHTFDPTEGKAYVAVSGLFPGTGKRQAGPSAQVWVLSADPPVSSKFLEYSSGTGDSGKCPRPDGPIECGFEQVALAAHAGHLVFATINGEGCQGGQVRIGLSDKADPYKIRLGKAEHTQTTDPCNIEFGVDVDDPPALPCTGKSRLSEERGASFPAIAARDEAGSVQALALWLAAPRPVPTNEACQSLQPIPIEGLGLFVPNRETGWLNATGDGKPDTLGETVSRSAPAITISKQSSPKPYLIAFPERAGVRMISAGFEASIDAPLSSSQVGWLPDEEPHHVVLTHGYTAGRADRVGMAWRSGCGAGAVLRFASFSWGQNRIEPLELPAGNIVSGPELLYAEEGFSEVSQTGGWFILWVEADAKRTHHLKLARVAELGNQLLGRRVLASGNAIHAVASVFEGSKFEGSKLEYALYDPTANEVSKNSARCGDSE